MVQSARVSTSSAGVPWSAFFDVFFFGSVFRARLCTNWTEVDRPLEGSACCEAAEATANSAAELSETCCLMRAWIYILFAAGHRIWVSIRDLAPAPHPRV